MTLQILLDQVISTDIKPSRIGPLRTAVRQYAAILGTDSSTCSPDRFNLSEVAVRQLIDKHAPLHLSTHTVRNLKNNICFLLRSGVKHKFLPPPADHIQSWKDAPSVTTRDNEGRTVQAWMPHRRTGQTLDAYACMPPRLEADWQEYEEWCTKPYAPDRPAKIQKRPVTMVMHRKNVSYVAGYLVQAQNRNPKTLRLRDIIEPKTLEGFVGWWIDRRGKVTVSIHHVLRHIYGIAKYWSKGRLVKAKDHQALVDAIQRIRETLPEPETVTDKRQSWLSLAELESIGRTRYPFNALRIPHRSSRTTARKVRDGWSTVSGKYNGFWVMVSLLLRLWVRIPLRSRNIREMQLDRNLYQDNGTWRIQFRGMELKVARRNGKENEITYNFPPELVPLLHEWLDTWRPRTMRNGDHAYVFMNAEGRPFTGPTEGDQKRGYNQLYHLLGRTTWKFSGISVNPHRIRDVWATEYIKSTRDIIGAAYMLGDKVETVLKHYAHLLDADAETRAVEWLHNRLDDTHS